MSQKRANPSSEAGALDCLAWRLDASDYTPLPSKHSLRLSHLRRLHGLSGPLAGLIATLTYGGAR